MEKSEEVVPAAWDPNEYQGRDRVHVSSSYKTGAVAFVVAIALLLGIGLAEFLFWLRGLLK